MKRRHSQWNCAQIEPSMWPVESNRMLVELQTVGGWAEGEAEGRAGSNAVAFGEPNMDRHF